MTFPKWLREQKDRGDDVGRLAAYVVMGDVVSLCADMLRWQEALRAAREEYEALDLDGDVDGGAG